MGKYDDKIAEVNVENIQNEKSKEHKIYGDQAFAEIMSQEEIREVFYDFKKKFKGYSTKFDEMMNLSSYPEFEEVTSEFLRGIDDAELSKFFNQDIYDVVRKMYEDALKPENVQENYRRYWEQYLEAKEAEESRNDFFDMEDGVNFKQADRGFDFFNDEALNKPYTEDNEELKSMGEWQETPGGPEKTEESIFTFDQSMDSEEPLFSYEKEEKLKKALEKEKSKKVPGKDLNKEEKSKKASGKELSKEDKADKAKDKPKKAKKKAGVKTYGIVKEEQKKEGEPEQKAADQQKEQKDALEGQKIFKIVEPVVGKDEEKKENPVVGKDGEKKENPADGKGEEKKVDPAAGKGEEKKENPAAGKDGAEQQGEPAIDEQKHEVFAEDAIKGIIEKYIPEELRKEIKGDEIFDYLTIGGVSLNESPYNTLSRSAKVKMYMNAVREYDGIDVLGQEEGKDTTTEVKLADLRKEVPPVETYVVEAEKLDAAKKAQKEAAEKAQKEAEEKAQKEAAEKAQKEAAEKMQKEAVEEAAKDKAAGDKKEAKADKKSKEKNDAVKHMNLKDLQKKNGGKLEEKPDGKHAFKLDRAKHVEPKNGKKGKKDKGKNLFSFF